MTILLLTITVDLSNTYTDANGTYALVTDDGFGGQDKLFSIENIIGSEYDDVIVGDDNNNAFYGLGGDDQLSGGNGDDTISGGEGNDIIDGGADTDTVDYSDTDSPITITIDGDTGIITVEDGSGGVDTLSNIENFIGSSSDTDTVVMIGDINRDSFSFEEIENIQADAVVTTLEDEFSNFSDDDLSLREALSIVREGGTISFDESLAGGTITLDSSLGQLEIDRSVTIDGLDITVDAQGNSRVIWVDDGDDSTQSTVEINGLTITGGFVDSNSGASSDFAAYAGSGAGIFNQESLTLSNTTVSGNTADYNAGIFNYFRADLSILDSTISGNKAQYHGGGIGIDYSTATITNSTISDNEAGDSDGGGIRQLGGSVTLTNSTVTNNTAGDDGGGVWRFSGQLNISSSLISGNTAADDGNEVHSQFGSAISSGGNNLFGDDSQTEGEALTNVSLADGAIIQNPVYSGAKQTSSICQPMIIC